MRNIFEGSFTEEVLGAGKAIFEGWSNFSDSKARKNLDSTASEVHIGEDRYAYSSTQEYQKLEGKLKHNSAGGKYGSDRGTNTGSEKILEQI